MKLTEELNHRIHKILEETKEDLEKRNPNYGADDLSYYAIKRALEDTSILDKFCKELKDIILLKTGWNTKEELYLEIDKLKKKHGEKQ